MASGRGLLQERTAGTPSGTGGLPAENGTTTDQALLDRVNGAVRLWEVGRGPGSVAAGGDSLGIGLTGHRP
ncbi:hypothetical protein [Streptomyces sp. NRRL S-448]|uniref:hypothetical protein n=1 Tax=Streptomyces sp. NRRL S-448 TaxID=1463907 RepID=UPI0035684093